MTPRLNPVNPTELKMRYNSISTVLVPLAYLILCLIIHLQHPADGRAVFLYYIAALPFSTFSLWVSNYFESRWIFIPLNTLWWYAFANICFFFKNAFPKKPKW